MLQIEQPRVQDTGKQSWRKESACKGLASEIFFAESFAPQAKQVCAICPVRKECRTEADAAGEAAGVWGGLSGLERGWAADGTRVVGDGERMVFVCVGCDAAVSWPMSALATESQLGQGRWRIQDEDGTVRFLLARSDGRDVQRGRGLSCRNGHYVGLTTGFGGLIAFDNETVVQVSMRQRRQPRRVA